MPGPLGAGGQARSDTARERGDGRKPETSSRDGSPQWQQHSRATETEQSESKVAGASDGTACVTRRPLAFCQKRREDEWPRLWTTVRSSVHRNPSGQLQPNVDSVHPPHLTRSFRLPSAHARVVAVVGTRVSVSTPTDHRPCSSRPQPSPTTPSLRPPPQPSRAHPAYPSIPT